MLTFQKLNACTFDQALQAWNAGFEGYFVEMKMSIDAFVRRMAFEGLSAELSVVAFAEAEPIGIVMSGVRTLKGQKVAYNGGTGVATRFRGQGVGYRLMQEAFDVYRAAEVDIATLEAISANERAIALYRKLGYSVQDRLVFLQQNGPLPADAFGTEGKGATYRVQMDLPIAASGLPFYRAMAPWQCQWSSLQAQGGNAVLVQDEAGQTVGYALYRRIWQEHNRPHAIVLYQCEAAPERADQVAIVSRLLREVFAPFEQNVRRQTFNFSEANALAVRLMLQAGFAETDSQVAMARPMKRNPRIA